VTGHFYADDRQLYVSSPAVDVEYGQSADGMSSTVDVNIWMRANRLRLNTDKTADMA